VRSLPNVLFILPMTMARSSSGRVTKPQGGRGSFVFFLIDNASCSIAFGTHTKMAEAIEMPFEMVSGLGLRNSVLRDDPLRGRSNFGGKCARQA